MDLKIPQKVKALRLASDLTQTELADRANLTKGFISQLENDQTSISVDSLVDILDALGVSLVEFFGERPDPTVIFSEKDRIEVEGKGASRFELLIPGSTNNLMDPIMIELESGERLDPAEPHPGEIFGYVLSGTATLILGKTKQKVRGNNCFYFKADQNYQIVNDGDRKVKLLWLSSPPQM